MAKMAVIEFVSSVTRITRSMIGDECPPLPLLARRR